MMSHCKRSHTNEPGLGRFGLAVVYHRHLPFSRIALAGTGRRGGDLVMNGRDRLLQWAATGTRQLTVLLATLLSLFPVYFMAVSAFKTKTEYLSNKWGFPQSPILNNFVTAFAGEKFFIRFANSTILTVGSVGVSLIIACLAAYAFARMDFPGKRTLFNVILSLMVVPPVVMVVPLFYGQVEAGEHLSGGDPDLHRAAAPLFDLPDDQFLPDYSEGDRRRGSN